MWHRIGFIGLAVIATPVSAKTYNLNFTPSVAQTSRLDRGVEIIDSVQKSTVVRIVEVRGADKKTVSFVIGVLNKGDASFVFGPENVTVRPTGIKPLGLVTYDEALEAERKRQKRESFWANVGAFGRNLSAADAGTQYGSGTYNGTTNGFVGGQSVSGYSSGTFSYTTQDSAAQLAAQRDAAAMNRQARHDLENRWAARSAAHETLLRPTTVDPGVVYGGYATFNIDKELGKAKAPLQVAIEVKVGGETHIFFARLSSMK